MTCKGNYGCDFTNIQGTPCRSPKTRTDSCPQSKVSSDPRRDERTIGCETLSSLCGGLTRFGENYVSEAQDKMQHFYEANSQQSLRWKVEERVEWHFIGRIQSNKLKTIARHFSWVHSLDSIKAAEYYRCSGGFSFPLQVCVQVNVAQEVTKAGVAPADLFKLLKIIQSLPKLQLRGLMCLHPAEDSWQRQREHFHVMKCLYEEMCQLGFAIDTLSWARAMIMRLRSPKGRPCYDSGREYLGTRNSAGPIITPV